MRRWSLVFTGLILLIVACSCHHISGNDASNTLSPTILNIPQSASTGPAGKLPRIVFPDTNYDFGTITAGQKVSHSFHFKNVGQADLIITGAGATCGCTKPTFPKDVKHPGDTGTISVTFDSSNKSGKVVKEITVSSNAQTPYKFLTITANIQPSNN